MGKLLNGDLNDVSLADEGMKRIDWAYQAMPVLRRIEDRFKADRPLHGVKVSACLHVTTETANLMRVLVAGGAQISLCASTPVSTQDDVVAALVEHLDVPTFAVFGASQELYYDHINQALRDGPQITMDDGADLVTELQRGGRELLKNVYVSYTHIKLPTTPYE